MDRIASDGGDDVPNVIPEYESLLMVAFGLSFPYIDLENYKMPVDLTPIKLDYQWEWRSSSPDDFGKDGQWW